MTGNPNAERVTARQIWPIIAPWRVLLTCAVFFVLIGAAVSLLPPLVMGRLIDENLTRGRLNGILQLALIYLGATIGVHVASFATAYSASIVAQGALRRLRVQLFTHLQKLPISYYDSTPIGDVIGRCTSDMETIERLFSSGVISLLAESARLIFTLGAMIALSFPLSITLMATLPLLIFITRRFQKLMRGAQREVRESTGILNAQLQEILTQPVVIKAFGQELRLVKKFRQSLSRTLGAQNRSIAYGAVYDPILKILQAALVAFFLIVGAVPPGTGPMGSVPATQIFSVSIGTLAAFILLFDQFFGPLIRIGNEWQVVQGALAGIERIFQVLTLPIDEGPAIGVELDHMDASTSLVSINHVTFGYVEDRPVLSDISLKVSAGTHVAVVGRTGAGKTSLFHLMGGLYHPWDGSIRLEGQDPRYITDEGRRSIVGTVPQNGWMFTGSIRENFTLWDNSISDDAIIAAAHTSGADAFIEKLPDKYDTTIGDSGIQLSAGERQLLALSRALVHNPSILLLDEATASVDSVTEASLKEAMRIHIRSHDGAVITIAHRIATAMEADRIVVMENGKLVEEGTPEQLIERNGRFAALWALEHAGWDWRQS